MYMIMIRLGDSHRRYMQFQMTDCVNRTIQFCTIRLLKVFPYDSNRVTYGRTGRVLVVTAYVGYVTVAKKVAYGSAESSASSENQ